MGRIVKVKDAISIAEELRKQSKTIVVVGGCFDILHAGHVAFLERAKQQGDFLFILLESDKTIKNTKGKDRPIHRQIDRAKVLAALRVVDYVVLLKTLKTNSAYDNLLCKIKPTIIATTKGDPNRTHKERQGILIHAKVIDVMERIQNASTSKLAKLLAKDQL